MKPINYTFLGILVLLKFSSSDPTDVPGNVLWLDASDVRGIFASGETFQSGTWVDKSTAGNADVIQTTNANLPQVVMDVHQGLSVVRFDGDDYMDVDPVALGMLNNVGGATLFGVLSTEATSGQRVLMISTGTSGSATRAGLNLFDGFGTNIAGTGNFGAAGRRLDTDPFQRIEGGTVNTGTLYMYAAAFDYSNSTVTLYVDGNQVTTTANFQSAGSTSPTNSTGIRVGADAATNNLRGTFTGDVGELVVYNRVLNTTERESVESYLRARWFQGMSVKFSLPHFATGINHQRLYDALGKRYSGLGRIYYIEEIKNPIFPSLELEKK